MLANAGQAALIAERSGKVPLILDPVLRASSGLELYGSAPETLLPLVRRATLVTPNVDESQALAHILGEAHAVLRKGGDCDSRKVLDTLETRTGSHAFSFKRFPFSVRGTGCALAARIAAELALGHSLLMAVTRAERWLHLAYARAR